jgi:hypothetical protein
MELCQQGTEQGGDGGFDAEDPRTDGQWYKSFCTKGLFFFLRETAFGADP